MLTGIRSLQSLYEPWHDNSDSFSFPVQVMCKLYFFVNYLAYTASILLLVVIAVERYIAIMHPLRSRGYFTAPRLLVAQVGVFVVLGWGGRVGGVGVRH